MEVRSDIIIGCSGSIISSFCYHIIYYEIPHIPWFIYNKKSIKESISNNLIKKNKFIIGEYYMIFVFLFCVFLVEFCGLELLFKLKGLSFGRRGSGVSRRNFFDFPQIGSILIEAVIMIGLIAALTPVLYTHISDRKEEIENINKANTLLMLQREAESFLKDETKRHALIFSNEILNFSNFFDRLGKFVNSLCNFNSSKEAALDNLNTKEEANICTSIDAIDNYKWLGNAVKCSGCGSNQVQARGTDILGYSCKYPYVNTVKCYDIPPRNGSVFWGERGLVRHKAVSITCNGKREIWHLIGGYISWWEAVEVCERLGLHMPPNISSLVGNDNCSEATRDSLLKDAFEVRTSTYVWTMQDYGNFCTAYGVFLNYSYASGPNFRNISNSTRFALCGPAI